MSNTNHKHESYEEFVGRYRNKNKPKKTSDDVMTPPDVMKVVQDYVAKRYDVDPSRFVRPFYPGGDFEAYPYKDDDIVVDNPPFSIEKRIVTYYEEHGIPFFIFVQSRTPCLYWEQFAQIHTGYKIKYRDNISVVTGFLTNLEQHAVIGDPELGRMLAAQPSQQRRKLTKTKVAENELAGYQLDDIARYTPYYIKDYTIAYRKPKSGFGAYLYTPDAVNLKEQFKQSQLEKEAGRWQI